VKFQMEQELAALAATRPGSRLVEIWNNLKRVTPLTKFKDRTMAVTRINGCTRAARFIDGDRSRKGDSSMPNEPKALSQLRDILLDKSVHFGGPFKLASGATTDVYVDCKPTTCFPPAMPLIGKLLRETMDEHGWQA
jgi:hypothetical protein